MAVPCWWSDSAEIKSMNPSSSIIAVSSWGQRLPWISLIASIAITIILIRSGDGRVPSWPMDQSFANVDLRIYHNGTNWIFQYPVLSWAGGITGSLLVGVYKLIVPTSPETLNWHVKILAAAGFLVSLFLLARTYLRNGLDQVAILSTAVTSGLLYLEPSTELFAGASLNLFAVAIHSDRRTLLQALTLAVFSLIKIELLPIGAMVAIFWVAASRQPIRRRLAFLLSFVVVVSVLIALSLHFHGYRTVFIGREMSAFEISYCYLFHGVNAPCLAEDMPDVRAFSDIVRNHADQYLRFVWASLWQSAGALLSTLNLLALGVPLLIAQAFRSTANGERLLLRLTLLVLAMTCIVAIMFAFVRPRYLTRSFGQLLVASTLALRKTTAKQRQQWLVDVLVLALTSVIVIINLIHLPSFLAAPYSF
jgi:hypothetical protein